MPHTHFGPSYQQCLFHYLLQVLIAHSWGWCHASQTLYSDCHYFKQAFILLGGIYALCVWTVKLWVNHWADNCWELKLLMVLFLKSSIFLGYFKESLAGGLEIELMKDSRLWQAVNRKRVLKEKQGCGDENPCASATWFWLLLVYCKEKIGNQNLLMTEETLISIELQIISFSNNILAFEETLSLNDLLENAFSRGI